MDKELKWIKKHYGEQMMQMCRTFFPRILEHEGLLSSILDEKFQRNKSLVEDIIKQNKQEEFKNYIYSLIDVESGFHVVREESAAELLDKAGYILYPECKTEEDLLWFKKFYAPGEELCSFWTDRLENCRVWFAVKKNVEEIERAKVPARQDEYGTSVISIQFTKGQSCTLSIKNRYNHSVNNPDNTFNSNLDNIIPGLTGAFYQDYGVKDMYAKRSDLELDGYIQLNGVYYKYNYEINGVYYCPGNIIIENYEVKKLEDHQMLIDYFVFDFKNKTVSLYDHRLIDGFTGITTTTKRAPSNDGVNYCEEAVSNIKYMSYDNGVIRIETNDGEIIEIKEKDRKIVALKCDDLTKCGHEFLAYNDSLEQLSMKKLTECGEGFLFRNTSLKKVNLPKLRMCGESFLSSNRALTSLSLPSLEECEGMFLVSNENLEEVYLPKLKLCGSCFLYSNIALKELFLPCVEEICGSALMTNKLLEKFFAPNLNEESRRLLKLKHRLLIETSEYEM